MIRQIEYIDISDEKEMKNPTKQQQAALDMLPKLELFCQENNLSVKDLEELLCLLERNVMTTPLTGN